MQAPLTCILNTCLALSLKTAPDIPGLDDVTDNSC